MKNVYLAILMAALLSLNHQAQASIELGLVAPSQSANNLEVSLRVSGLGDGTAPALSGYDLSIFFDANQLAFSHAEFGDPLLGKQLDLFNAGLNPSISEITASGVLQINELSLDTSQDLIALQADTFTLATLHFNILQTGSSQLEINLMGFSDSDGNPLLVTVSNATVTTVPIPATVWLMLSGMCLAFRRPGKIDVLR